MSSFILALIEMAKKNYNWLDKSKAFRKLVNRYLASNFEVEENKQGL